MLIRKLFRRAFLVSNHVITPLWESVFLQDRPCEKAYPPIFLLGPPRSGSTVIMQVLTDAFKLGYLSNRHCAWFGAPVLAEKLFHPLTEKSVSDYTSKHGRTEGLDAPSECGAWWYRFFRRDPAYVTLGDVSDRKMMAFRRSLMSFSQSVGLPLIFKNLYATLRIEPIAHHVPNALFVVIERDWVDNAQSILKGRNDALGRYDQWWSVPPPDVDALSKLPPVQQVVGQIQSIHELVVRDIVRLGLEDRTFRIRYEDFCEDVQGTLAAFEAFMKHHGVELEHRFDVPSQFSIPRSIKIPESMYEELKIEVTKRKRRADAGGENSA
ncbi:sulfotransferase [Halothiobacillus sp.]|uniref:sulfotransferase n=1 Tax=Halothiobacillus sp. TaxID=1891311 RepID=UPI002AD29F7D|nr:sulfotransferase [Halothiobacillus sp.]